MYPIDEHDRVVELDSIPKPVTGAPEPIVVADEQAVVVSLQNRTFRTFHRSARNILLKDFTWPTLTCLVLPTTKPSKATRCGIVVSVSTAFIV
jgi:hypothetical protein